MINFIEKLIPKKIMPLYKKYKTIIWYLIFGGLSTVINILVYYVFYNFVHISNEVSNIIAWAITIVFVYFTNRVNVFESKANTMSEKFKEFVKFVFARIFTGVLDLCFMSFTVTFLNLNSLLMKIFSNIIVIVTNYILSKLVVFKSKR